MCNDKQDARGEKKFTKLKISSSSSGRGLGFVYPSTSNKGSEMFFAFLLKYYLRGDCTVNQSQLSSLHSIKKAFIPIKLLKSAQQSIKSFALTCRMANVTQFPQQPNPPRSPSSNEWKCFFWNLNIVKVGNLNKSEFNWVECSSWG